MMFQDPTRAKSTPPRPAVTSEPLLPARLNAGDTVAVCTPSAPGAPLASQRFNRGLDWLRQQGFRVAVGAQAFATGYAAGPAKARAEEFNAALRDPSIRAIFTVIGGLNSNAILPYLDYSAFTADPKVIVGYSDITALLLGLHARTGVVTFHGPTLMPELAEFPSVLDYTERSLLSAVTVDRPIGPLAAAQWWTEEFLLWDSADTRPRELRSNEGWDWIGTGSGTGPLIGGNLETISALTGTSYLPDTTGAVLFWETCGDSIAKVDRDLCHLDAAGVTDGIVAMVVGRSFRAGAEFERQLRGLVADRYGTAGFPLVAGVELGHPDPMLTLPIGVPTLVDATSRTIEILGPAVR